MTEPIEGDQKSIDMERATEPLTRMEAHFLFSKLRRITTLLSTATLAYSQGDKDDYLKLIRSISSLTKEELEPLLENLIYKPADENNAS